MDEPTARTNNHKRPKSMVAMLSGGLISSGVANGNKPVDRATQKRLSWYQGIKFHSFVLHVETIALGTITMAWFLHGSKKESE